mgnify:FL=1
MIEGDRILEVEWILKVCCLSPLTFGRGGITSPWGLLVVLRDRITLSGPDGFGGMWIREVCVPEGESECWRNQQRLPIGRHMKRRCGMPNLETHHVRCTIKTAWPLPANSGQWNAGLRKNRSGHIETT